MAADDADLVALAGAQAELRQTALGVAARMLQRGRARAERQALAAAVDAMGRAEAALRAASTGTALAPQTEALAALLRAQAAIRRTRVSRDGGQSTAWRPQDDLSALFDRDLRREQKTNYEERPAMPPADARAESDALRRVRELAQRQEALGRAQDDLARRREALDDVEAARVLARLTHEQEELRKQAEALERDIEAAAGGRPSRSSGSSSARPSSSSHSSGSRGASRLSEPSGSSESSRSSALPTFPARSAASDPAASSPSSGPDAGAGAPMRRALAELRRGQVAEAAERAREALGRLRDLERTLAAESGPDAAADRRRLAAELQAAGEVRRSLERLEARLGGRVGTERAEAGRELEAPGAVARALLRRLEELPDVMGALRAAQPGALEDLTRRAAPHPAGGGPAIEAFEQDFTAWESLRDLIRRTIEMFEADRTRELRAAETRGRLDVGAGEAAPAGYGALVDRYYRALADQAPRRRPQRR